MAEYELPSEDRETLKRARTRRRIGILAGCLVAIMVTRFIIKDPPPPKAPDHSDKPFRAIPGILKNLPDSERKKLTPQQLALLQAADQNLTGMLAKIEIPVYKPMEAPIALTQKMKIDDKKFEYALREEKRPELPEPEQIDHSKDTLILFKKGGYLKAQEAQRIQDTVRITLDRATVAQVPRALIRSISPNAANWVEPIPAGYTLLKPARGISVVVSSYVAERITLEEKDPDAS